VGRRRRVVAPRIFRLIEELHEPAEDVTAIFRKYDSELL
jgi:hypothetical protein